MKSVLIFTVHKAASMFLHQLATEVTNKLAMKHYSDNNKYFHGIRSYRGWKAFIENKLEQNQSPACFGPIRVHVTIRDDILSASSIVLHLRDPRDVLTSLFFSQIYSHPRQPGKFNPSDIQVQQWKEMGIDKFVLNC